MAAPPSKTEPYERNEGVALLPEEAIRVWKEVAECVASEKQGEFFVGSFMAL